MKWCVGFLLMFSSLLVKAQVPDAGMAPTDRQIYSAKTSTLDSLSTLLFTPQATERERVRAIYSWICHNIRYNVDVYRPLARRVRFIPEPIDTVSEWKSADEMYALKVLKRGVAVCEGYARLFKVLCQYAGVEAVVLNGYVRTNTDRSPDRFRTNHTWNAIRIDSTWHLVDATWGAGFVTYADEFVQEQNDFYFLTPPEQLIRDHYPEDLRWTLLAEPPTLAEFRKMPFKSKSFVKYGIQSYAPSGGWLEAEPGDTLSFAISLYDIERSKRTSADPFADTSRFSLSPASVFVKPELEKGNQVYYSFVVDAGTRWVHLLFNGDVILRYHSKLRSPLASN